MSNTPHSNAIDFLRKTFKFNNKLIVTTLEENTDKFGKNKYRHKFSVLQTDNTTYDITWKVHLATKKPEFFQKLSKNAIWTTRQEYHIVKDLVQYIGYPEIIYLDFRENLEDIPLVK